MSQEEKCEAAFKNPSCPYVAEINKNSAAIFQVEKALVALLGEDCTGLNTGIIRKILTKLDELSDANKVQKSWINTFKPLFISLVSAALGSAITYLVFLHF